MSGWNKLPQTGYIRHKEFNKRTNQPTSDPLSSVNHAITIEQVPTVYTFVQPQIGKPAAYPDT